MNDCETCTYVRKGSGRASGGKECKMDAKKITALVMSIILVAALAFSLTWTIVNWDNVKKGMDGTNLYTAF